MGSGGPEVDWGDVLATADLDSAVEMFTNKFNFVLNQHAPWKLFQARKKYVPWLTEATKELMEERDAWKTKAKELAAANPGHATQEQQEAWGKYKKLRNNKRPTHNSLHH